MDFKGQQRSEKLALKMLVTTAVISFLLGYFKQDFMLMMGLFGTGFLVTFAVTVPNWPMYNKDPIEWVRSKSKVVRRKSPESLVSSLKKLFH